MSDRRNMLNAINLNLLPVLDALLRHGNATRAAEELGVTPSAVSHSLRELRAVFGDALFVRTRYGLSPTKRAQSVEAQLRLALASLEEVVARPDRFDPATSSRRCVLVTADDAMATVLPSFAATVLRKAPGMTLEIRPRIVPMVDELEAESVDLVIQLERELPSWAGSVQLYRDGLVCVVREGHPDVGDALTLEQFCRLPHVRISPEGFGASGLDRMLEAMGVERRIAVYAFSFAMAPEIVMRTDAVLTMPIRQARVIAPRLGLRLVEPPFEMPWFATQLVWHRGRDDSALAWLREQLVESAQADMERDTV